MKKQGIRLAVTCAAVLAVTGCTSTRPFGEQTLPMAKTEEHKNQVIIQQENEQVKNEVESAATKFAPVKKLPSIGAYKDPDKAKNQLNLGDEPLTLNADALPLFKFVNFALGDVLKLDYIVDEKVSQDKRPVTLRITQPVSPVRMLGLVEEVLRLSDVALMQSEGLVKVVPAAKAKDIAPEVVDRNVKRLLKYGHVIEFVPLYHLPVSQASQLAYSFVSKSKGKVLVQSHLNALVMVANQEDIDRFRAILRLIDQPSPITNYSTIVSPAFNTAESLSDILMETLPQQGIPVAENIAETVTGVTVTAIGDSNRLLVTSSSQKWLDYTKYWISQIDRPRQQVASEESIFTYFLKNTQAAEIGDVIQEVFGSGSGQDLSGRKADKKTESAVRPANMTTAADKGKREKRSKASSAGDDERYKIVMDEARNALIFVGSYDDYAKVLDLLKVLDKRPRQVLIEAQIVEVTLDNGSDFGVNWTGQVGDISGGTAGSKGSGGLALPTGALLLTGSFGDITANLAAAAKDERLQILSSPRLLARDGERARISVGDQISVKTGTISGGGSGENPNVVDSFSYIETGVILELTPTINEGGIVEIELSQEVSEVKGRDVSETPPIIKRKIETFLVAESGQTIMLGGLISQNQSETVNKVPVLGDLPLLGQLFKSTSIVDRKTELVVIITPHIIYDKADADFYTQEFRNVLGWELTQPLYNGSL